MKWTETKRASGLIEHVCEHGVGHPDPMSSGTMDTLYGHKPGTWSIHGCDGCCSRDDFPGKIEKKQEVNK